MNYPVSSPILFPVTFNDQTEYIIIYGISESYAVADTPFYIINHILSKICIYDVLMF